MSSNTYSNPRLYIGNKEITSFSSINFRDSGKNQACILNVTVQDPHLNNAALEGKEIKFFLNHGSIDTVPFFRGRIRQITPTNTSVSITAYDVRTLLTGKSSIPISLTDEDNYDGYTLSQFLYSYITDNINIDDTLIGLDLLNESDPVVTLTGVRQENTSALKIVDAALKQKNDDLTDIRNTRMTVIDDGLKSNICFVTEQDKDNACVRFSYSNGIKNVAIKKRARPNVLSTSVEGTNVVYKHNNMKTGVSGKTIKGEFEYPDQAREAAYIEATKLENAYEITLNVTKGHYLNIGNLVHVSLPEHPDVTGKHRIVAKSIAVGKDITCSLSLSKETPKSSDFILSN